MSKIYVSEANGRKTQDLEQVKGVWEELKPISDKGQNNEENKRKKEGKNWGKFYRAGGIRLPEVKALRTKGPRSSLLQMAEERRSWSNFADESPSAAAGTTLRRIFDDCIVV